MPQEEDKSGIEDLNNSLYSRNAPLVRSRRKLRIDDQSTDIQSAWERPPEALEPIDASQTPKHHMSFLTKLLIGSIIFCIIAVGVGAYMFLNGSNVISGNNIEIVINGPISVPGGTPVSFDIVITNNNNVELRNVEMSVSFPPGTTDPSDPTSELSTFREKLGSIKAGDSVRKPVQAIFFGEENVQKTVTVAVVYEVKDSTSPFNKEQTYDILVNSSPINLTVTSFKEITSGQEFDLTLNVKSNSGSVLKNVLLKAVYPFGFTFLSSSLKPTNDNATWKLGDLPPGGQRTINIRGKLQGENQDTRVFHFSVGSQSTKNANIIGTEYFTAIQEIALKKSFMTVGVAVDNNKTAEDAVGYFNKPVRVDISYFNNLPTAISAAEITVKLSGSAYDRSLVQPLSGYFHSSTDEIVWNSQTSPDLGEIGAGESGTLSFNVTPKDQSTPTRPLLNPTLTFSVSVNGKRTQESRVPESLTSLVTRTSRISTSASLSGRIVRSGTLANTGPIPPKADLKTSYTVIWSIDNTANILNKAQVTATLPPYVKWVKLVSPPTEDVTYDTKTGKVTWNAGTVGTYTARSGQRKTVSFQVSFEPNVNQVGSVPILVNEAELTAVDDFTGANIHSSQSSLSTRFSTDPTYRSGDETVR